MKPQEFSPLLNSPRASIARGLCLLVFLVISGACASSFAQDHAEIFCEGEDSCVPDSFVFRWDENGESVLVLDGEEGELAATVFLDTRSDMVMGWFYGLRHDPAALTLLGNECGEERIGFLCGTDAAEYVVEPFYNHSAVVGEAEGSEAGFISAVILSFVAPAHLPAGRLNSIAKLTYRVGTVPGTGTMVRFVADELRTLPESPTVGVVIEVGGDGGGGGSPQTVVHGRLEVPFVAFRRGDVNDSGALEVTDAINFLTWMFLGGSAPACMDAADADNNGRLGLSDAINVLVFLFGGDAPPGPATVGGGCEADPEGDDDGLLCESYTNC